MVWLFVLVSLAGGFWFGYYYGKLRESRRAVSAMKGVAALYRPASDPQFQREVDELRAAFEQSVGLEPAESDPVLVRRAFDGIANQCREKWKDIMAADKIEQALAEGRTAMERVLEPEPWQGKMSRIAQAMEEKATECFDAADKLFTEIADTLEQKAAQKRGGDF